jgi:type IV secretory pathway VirB10-like protein
MDHNQAWLIAVTSMVPPAVLAHLLHLAATPVPRAEEAPAPVLPAVTMERAEAPVPPMPEQAPALPPTAEAAPELEPAAPAEEQRPKRPAIVYRDARCTVIRPLYDGGTRPGTAAMRDALITAGHGRVGDSTIRGTIRAEIEEHEPELADYPPAIGRTA